MIGNKTAFWFMLLSTLVLLAFIPSCLPYYGNVDSYVAIVPKTLYSGENTSFSISLFSGDNLAFSPMTFSINKDKEEVFSANSMVPGKGTVEFQVPSLP